MAKGEKVNSKSKAKAPPPPPPSDISSSDLSDSSSDDESSDKEIDQITKNLDSKTKLFITKLMEDLESVQAELESRQKTLIQQEDLYIASKEALALERIEMESLRKALAKEQGGHAITKKENITLKKKYCDLDEKHKELELQHNVLWDSNSHPSKAKDVSTPFTSQGCGKCYNIDLNAYSTNLANMEAMRKEIARLNEIIGKGCLSGKAVTRRKMIQKCLNSSKGDIPQSSMGLGTLQEPKEIEEIS
jgi:chromosome segregation ATPase